MSSINRILIFLTAGIIAPNFILAQGQDKELSRTYMEIAEEMMKASQAYDDIRDNMVLAADADTTNFKANFEAGHLHIRTINRGLAVKYFLRIYRQMPAYRFDLEYWIANSYQYGLEFEKALDFYNRYKTKLSAKSSYQGKDKVPMTEVDRRIRECENGKRFMARPGKQSIVNVGREINSEMEDYGPVLNEDETELVFTSRRREGNQNEDVASDNKPFEDIYITSKKGDSWARAKSIGPPVDSKSNESSIALSADGNTLFIYYDEGNGDIYVSERQGDGTWSAPEPLPGIINSTYRESSVSITKDGKTLYFASERPGGLGGSDIYSCTQDRKGVWTKVKNLGPAINTEYDEDGPFIDYDSKTLYFSSMGHNGVGGFDIYRSSLVKDEWTEPENLGFPINTPDDDSFFVSTKDGKRGYYSSVRDDGMGYSDIYMITIPERGAPVDKSPVKEEPVKEEPKKEPVKEEPVKEEPKKEPVKEEPKKEPVKEEPKKEPVKEVPKKIELQPLKYVVTVVDADSKGALDAKVKLQGFKDNIVVGVSSKGQGVFEFNITQAETKDYRLSVEQEGYVFQNLTVRIEGAKQEAKTIAKKIEMRKLAVGVTGILRNIYFDFAKATFKQESYNELNKLLTMMQQNTGMKVEISGHTDSFGDKVYNKNLSQLRANAVKAFLVSKGVDARRVKPVGYGEERPLASNDDENEGREYNRRVEFKVLGN
jgi:outer membrane protein OmpA-like peptidoglycan-associated protein